MELRLLIVHLQWFFLLSENITFSKKSELLLSLIFNPLANAKEIKTKLHLRYH